MIRVITEPVRGGRGDLEMAAYKVATFAKTHPGQWCQTDELPCNYAGRITSGMAREFQPETEWQTSQKGGLLSVRYLGPGAVYRDVRVRGVGRDARRPGVDILTGHRERVS